MNNETPLPHHFVEQLSQQFPDRYLSIISSLQAEAPTTIHLNRSKQNQQWLNKPSIGWWEHGKTLEERPSFTLDPLFHAGCYYPQESSSMFIGYLLQQLFDREAKITLLDMCAAPGGKSILASTLFPEGRLISNEINKVRNSILQENSIKWGNINTITTSSEALRIGELTGFFDVILIDAPCSGEGMFRKDDHARSEWSLENVDNCVIRQHQILDELTPALKDGGFIIYSTCTFNRKENEDQVLQFLSENPFSSVHIPTDAFPSIEHIEEMGFHAYRFIPDRTPGEGFFCTVLQKHDHARLLNTRSSKKSYWRTLNKKELSVIQPWLNSTDQLIINDKNEVYHSPFSVDELHTLILHCYITMPGTPIGTIIREDFVPDHALSMTSLLSDKINRVEVDLEQALKFLRKEDQWIELPKGWAVLTYQQTPIGFVKGLGNRINNYYPKEWRIRMK